MPLWMLSLLNIKWIHSCNKMNKLYLLILGTALSFQCSGQNSTLVSSNNFFLVQQADINTIKDLEENLNGNRQELRTPIYLASDFLPESQSLLLSPYPLIFTRSDVDFKPAPKVDVYYFYSEKDSTLKLITYNWDAGKIGSDLKDVKKRKNGSLKEFEVKYELIQNQLIDILGKPVESDLISKKIQKENFGEWWERSAIWEKEQAVVELKMIFTEDNEYDTKRIRVKVYWN